MIKQVASKLTEYLSDFTTPHPEDLVLSLVLNTASLELAKGAFVELAPIKGTCGPFRLTGNSLPVFTYQVFDKKLMEFIVITVEVSRPDRIEYSAKIMSTDPLTNGESTLVMDAYKKPFITLTRFLFKYFPITRKASHVI